MTIITDQEDSDSIPIIFGDRQEGIKLQKSINDMHTMQSNGENNQKSGGVLGNKLFHNQLPGRDFLKW